MFLPERDEVEQAVLSKNTSTVLSLRNGIAVFIVITVPQEFISKPNILSH